MLCTPDPPAPDRARGWRPTGGPQAPLLPHQKPSSVPNARAPYLSPWVPTLPPGQLGNHVHHPVPSELLGQISGKVEPRAQPRGWHRATGKQEVALRWREAEPSAYFLSGLRKCCRDRLPERVCVCVCGWGVPQIWGTFTCPRTALAAPLSALITNEF